MPSESLDARIDRLEAESAIRALAARYCFTIDNHDLAAVADLFALVEGVRQLRGTAANAIAGAEVALIHTNGGSLSSQATAVLGRAN